LVFITRNMLRVARPHITYQLLSVTEHVTGFACVFYPLHIHQRPAEFTANPGEQALEVRLPSPTLFK